MNAFFDALRWDCKSEKIPKEHDYFGKLMGSWKIKYIDHNTSRTVKGEWHFSWILEGMAVQDVIVIPSRDTKNENPHPDDEYGTTLRVYNPNTHFWDIAYCYAGRIIQLEARKQGEAVVLTYIEDERRKWVFAKIEDNAFHWRNVTVKNDGEWHINADIYAERTNRHTASFATKRVDKRAFFTHSD